MRKSLILVLTAIVATLLAHFVLADRGYVLINFRGVAFETSLPGLILVLLLLYTLVRVLVHLFRAPRKFGEAVGEQREARARRKLHRGLIEMAEGNFARGEKLLAAGARSSDTPLLNYLSAARAAHRQGAHERRDNWLMLAYEQDTEAGNAVLLTQAELQLAHKQYEEALATLRKIEDNEPGHGQSMALLAKIYAELEDWDNLRDLLPKLRKKKTIAPDEIDAYATRVYSHAIATAGESGDAATIATAWKDVPAHLKTQPGLLAAYARAMAKSGDAAGAEKTLRKTLNKSWDNDLAIVYGEIDSDAAKQLSVAEGWLKTRGDDPSLLLTTARLAMRNELWGKARSYLESAIAIDPRADAYHLYGQLLDQMGEDGALRAFRKGLALATGSATDVPVLTGPAAKEG